MRRPEAAGRRPGAPGRMGRAIDGDRGGSSPVTVADGRSRRVLAQYVALALTWGASFLFVELGLAGLSPAQVVLSRLVVGALTLAAVAAAAGSGCHGT